MKSTLASPTRGDHETANANERKRKYQRVEGQQTNKSKVESDIDVDDQSIISPSTGKTGKFRGFLLRNLVTSIKSKFEMCILRYLPSCPALRIPKMRAWFASVTKKVEENKAGSSTVKVHLLDDDSCRSGKPERDSFKNEYLKKRRCLDTAVGEFAYGRRKRKSYERELAPHVEDIISFLAEGVEELWRKADNEHQVVLQLHHNIENLEMQMRNLSAELEEYELMKSSQLARLAEQKQNNMSGFYLEESATPVNLNQAVEAAQVAISRFTQKWFEHLASNSHTFAGGRRYAPYYFARSSHVLYAVRGDVNRCFFKNFEREDYADGNSIHLDPGFRQVKCLEDAQSTLQTETPEFHQFCRRKFYHLKKFCEQYLQVEFESAWPRDNVNTTDQNLESDFVAAARRVWLLHKLAFSFEPPARVFRVQDKTDFEQTHMKPIVTMADDDNFVPTVGFMVAPGFFLGKTTIKAEIYLGTNGTLEVCT